MAEEPAKPNRAAVLAKIRQAKLQGEDGREFRKEFLEAHKIDLAEQLSANEVVSSLGYETWQKAIVDLVARVAALERGMADRDEPAKENSR